MTKSFLTSCRAEVEIKLSQSKFMARIFASFQMTSQKSNCDVIIDRHLSLELGRNLNFQNHFVGWKETNIPMKSINYKMRTNSEIQESTKILRVQLIELRKF